MIETTRTISGKFRASPGLLIHKAQSDEGMLEVRSAEDGSVQLTIREDEHAAGVGITVDREELEQALELIQAEE
jgi:hypothetical protein